MPVLADKGTVELKMSVEQEIKTKDADGNVRTKRVAPKLVLPKDEVIYTIRYHNSGEQEATDVVITNPIPADVIYRAGSAKGLGTKIRFSVNGGKQFGEPDELTVTLPDGKERPATESDYTHINWTLLKPVAAGKRGQVSYRARVR